MSIQVLLVEDEPILAEIVQESLQSRGFEVTHAATLAAAKSAYHQQKPQIIVLDVMLPDGSGFDLAKQIRNVDIDTPIIFLTAKSLPNDVVEGFESGGNDYLKKPFSMEELIVRVKALVNKNRMMTNHDAGAQSIDLGNYQFKYPKGSLMMMGVVRTLTSRESAILHLLILNRNRIITRNEILMNLWGYDDYFSGRSLDVFITKLRRYLKDDASVSILNIRGQGYKLIY